MARAAVNDIEPSRSRPFGLGDAMILIVALAWGCACRTRHHHWMSLLDVMIMIAATAAGLAMIRGPVPGVLHVFPVPPIPFLIPRPALEAVLLILTAWPLPAMWTIALLSVALAGPGLPGDDFPGNRG